MFLLTLLKCQDPHNTTIWSSTEVQLTQCAKNCQTLIEPCRLNPKTEIQEQEDTKILRVFQQLVDIVWESTEELALLCSIPSVQVDSSNSVYFDPHRKCKSWTRKLQWSRTPKRQGIIHHHSFSRRRKENFGQRVKIKYVWLQSKKEQKPRTWLIPLSLRFRTLWWQCIQHYRCNGLHQPKQVIKKEMIKDRSPWFLLIIYLNPLTQNQDK